MSTIKTNILIQTSLTILSIIVLGSSFNTSSAETIDTEIDTDKSSLTIDTLLHFGSGFSDTFQAPSGSKDSVNLNNKTNSLSILSAGFKVLAQEMDQYNREASSTATGTGPARVTSPPLVYPNPFRQKNGAKLGYGLAGEINEIEIQIYDMMANLITKKTFKDQGARQGYNFIDINLQTFDGHYLSAGVYFLLILNDGKVLAKGKVAVIP
ncbi:MAG: T9SS type A sorting domain-containing protein [Candidatus Margulisbacteria bacterium]|nr:T9SS type A sorting domain-containing protein [Candidatus Margulisiibacteriota bacterium]